MAETEREKALDAALGQIEKQFGKGSVMRMGDNLAMNIESVPTGALSLDLALGIGGLPRGRIVEIYGPESSGKSTLAMHVVAEAQRNGGICAYVDAEHAMDPVYAWAIGVNIDDLLISQPDTGEQALEIADMLIRSGALDVLVVDSVAALTPRAEIEGEMGDTHVGLQARLMSQALRKLTGTLSKSSTIAIFINQLREKIGVMYGCFHYGAKVVLADGSTEKIGRIVNQRLPVEVLSYDPKAGAIVPKRIVNWFDNGTTDRFLQITVAKPAKNGRAQLACTSNHLIRTPGGWCEAGELKVGDRVLEALPHYLSDFQWEALRGTLMGDGALSPTRAATAPGSAIPTARNRHPTQTGRHPCSPTSDRAAVSGATGSWRTTSPPCRSWPRSARAFTSTRRRCSTTITSSISLRSRWLCGTRTTGTSRSSRRVCRSGRRG